MGAEPGYSAVGARPPALGAPLPPGPAAPRGRTGVGDAAQRLGGPRASRRRRAEREWGKVGAAGSGLCPRAAAGRARRAPLGPSRDRGGAPRTEDWGRARRVSGSGPIPPGLRVLAGAGGGDLVQPGSGAGRGSGVPEAKGVRGQAGKGSQPCAPGVSLSPGFCINRIGTRPSSQGCFEN